MRGGPIHFAVAPFPGYFVWPFAVGRRILWLGCEPRVNGDRFLGRSSVISNQLSVRGDRTAQFDIRSAVVKFRGSPTTSPVPFGHLILLSGATRDFVSGDFFWNLRSENAP